MLYEITVPVDFEDTFLVEADSEFEAKEKLSWDYASYEPESRRYIQQSTSGDWEVEIVG